MKNAVLAAAMALATLAGALLLLRLLAPGLLGAPQEVRLVQSSEQVPPFYEHVFDSAGRDEPLPDPVTVVREAPLQRARPGEGPTDVLGFRNPGVPNRPEVVVIGDSQAYGLGEELEDTWPQRLGEDLGAGVYTMAANGWGPTQYVAMAQAAVAFRPRVVLVAYYTGNDAHDAFTQAYNNPKWQRLRVSETLTRDDQPAVIWPIPENDRWRVAFPDGVTTVFTPGYRFSANDRSHPGVREGYDVLAKTATLIARSFEEASVVFTVIPTKELTYEPRVRLASLEVPEAYERLVADEAANLAELVARLRGMRRAHYVDVAEALRRAATGGTALYPEDTNGHPNARGHETIAAALAPALRELLQDR